MRFSMWLLFLLITGCRFEPLFAPPEQHQALDICVKSQDRVLAHLLKKELLFHEALLIKHKAYRILIDVSDKQKPLIYSSKGDIERWHECLQVILTVTQDNRRHVKQINSYSTFQDQGDFGYLSLHERTRDKLIQDIVRQIIMEIAWLFQTQPALAQTSNAGSH